jgi:methionine-rich copper-binding protein CopC
MKGISQRLEPAAPANASSQRRLIGRGIVLWSLLVALVACTTTIIAPGITLSSEMLQLDSKVGKSISGSFSFENSGNSVLNYSISIPSGDSWLKISSGASGTVPVKGKQTLEASATCPATVGELVSTITISASGYSISAPFIIKLNCQALDTTPDDFSLTSVNNAEPASDVTSNVVTIAGLDDAVAVAASNGALVLVNGNPGTMVRNADKLSVRLRSSMFFETTVTSNVSVGSLARSFSVSTRKEPMLGLSLNPNSLSLPKGGNGVTSVQISRSNSDKSVLVTAQNLPAGVSVGELSIASGSSSGQLTFSASSNAAVGGPFNVVVTASSDGKSASQTLKLTISGASSEPLKITGYRAIQSLVNQTITAQIPLISGGTTPYSLAIAPALPTGLVINASSGEISGAASLAQAKTSHRVTVTDASGQTASTALDVEVIAALGIAKAYSAVEGTIGYPLKFPGQVLIEGGTKPYRFSIAPTGLPAGLVFAGDTGVISGTPTVVRAAQNYIVTVQDQAGLQLTMPVKVGVSPAPVFVKGYQSLMNQLGHGENLPQTPETSGGSLPLRFSAPNLSNNTGIGFDSNTGTLFGAPSKVAGEEQYTVTVFDRNDAPASTTFRIMVTPELAPAVVSSQPAALASMIDPALRQITLSFNEAVDISAGGASLQCDRNGTLSTIPINGLPSNNSSVLLLRWSIDLPLTATCTLKLNKEAVHDSDSVDGPDTLEADYRLSFTTIDLAPSVVSTVPANNAVGVAANSKIKLNFSENLDLQAGAVSLQCPLGSPIALLGLPKSNVSEIELTPASALPDVAVTCTVTLQKDKLDDSDSIDPPSSLAADYSFQFPVDAAPKVLGATPAADSINGIATALRVSWSEPISLDAGVASASCSQLSAPFTVSSPAVTALLDASQTILTVSPATKWPEAANCTITLDKSKIHDGDSIDPPDNPSNSFSRSFKTDASPNDIGLSNASVAENQAAGTLVGNFSTADPDVGQIHSYTLVAGSGDSDNSSFSIVGNQLKTNASFNFENKSSYSLRVRSTDNGVPALSFDKQFMITVTNANEAPTAIALTNSAIDENAPAATVIGTLSSSDPDMPDSFSYSIVAGLDGASFSINNDSLRINGSPDFEVKSSYSLRIRSTDLAGLFFEQVFTITINNLNDGPINAVPVVPAMLEDASNVAIGGLSVSDQDIASNDLKLTLNASNGSLTLGSSSNLVFLTNTASSKIFTGTLTSVNAALASLQFTPNANFNGSASIQIISDDQGHTGPGGAKTDTDTINISVLAVNDRPSFSKGSNQTVLEDSGAQTVNTWATILEDGDPEINQNLSLSVTGNSNPALFSVAPSINGITGNLTYTSAANANGVATITIQLGDDGGTANGGINTSPTQSFQITVTAVNDAPSFVKGADQSINENDGPQTVSPWASAINPGPSDESGQTVSFNITSNSNMPLFSSPPSITNGGVLSYTPTPSTSGVATITITLTDNGPGTMPDVNTSAIQSFTITVNPINDAPVNTVIGQTVDEDVATTLTGISIADIDVGGSNITATLSVPSGSGSFSSTVMGVTGSSTNSIALTGTLANVNSFLGAVKYTSALNANGSVTATLLTDDGGNTGSGGAKTDSDTFTITITAVNDAPVNTVIGQTLDEDVATTLTGLSVADVDVGGSNIAATLSVPNGNGTFSSTVMGVTGSGTNSIALTSTLTNVNSFLGAVKYTSALNASGSVIATLLTNDGGNTGSGGVKTDSDTFTITITAVNDAPVNTVIGQTLDEDVATTLTGLSVTDVDAAASSVTATLSVPNGSGSFSSTAMGVTGSGTNSIALTSTLTNVNSFLGAVKYTSALNSNGSVTATLLTDDGGNTGTGGAKTDSDSFTITITAVNDAPVNTVANQTVNEDVAATLTGLSVADVDVGGANITATLSVPNGSGTFSSTASGVTGSGSNSIALTSTLTNVNSFLAAVKYTSALNANSFSAAPRPISAQAPIGGNVTATLLTNDGGNTGTGGNKTDSDTFTITITAVNDVPSFTKGMDQTNDQQASNTAYTVNPWATALSAGPSNESSQTLSFIITANDNSALFSTAPSVSSTGVLTYSIAANQTGVANISLVIKDTGGTTNGGVDTSAAQSFKITVQDINDPPVNTVAAQTVDEDVATTLSGLSVADVDVGGANITATLSVANGSGTFSSTAMGVTGSGSNSIALTSTLANVNAFLAGVKYTSDLNANGNVTATLLTDDGGNTGIGGVKTDSDTFTITITAVNDAPTDIGLTPTSIAENSAGGSTVGTFSSTDVDVGQTHSYTLVMGTGDTDNASFTIDMTGNLKTAAVFDFETKNSYSIRVRTTDNGTPPLNFEKVFTISVTNVNEAPTDIGLSSSSIDENTGANAVVGTLSSTDPDAGSSFSYSILAGGDGASFNISGGNLRLTSSANFELKSSYSVNLRTTDNGMPGLTFDKSFTITVIDKNDPPTGAADTFKGVGNTRLEVVASMSGCATAPCVQIVGSVLTNDSDEDPGSTLTVNTPSIISGISSITLNSAGTFALNPAAGRSSASFSYIVSDNGRVGGVNGAAANASSSTITVTINFEGMVWYVKNNAVGANNGTSGGPFTTIGAAQTAAGPGHTIFVYNGSSSSASPYGGIVLRNNQRLIGEHFGLTMPFDGGTANLVPASVGYPFLKQTGAGVFVVTLTDITGTEIRGLEMSSSGSGSTKAIAFNASNNAVSSTTITHNKFTDNLNAGVAQFISSSNAGMNITIQNNVVNNVNGLSFVLNANGSQDSNFSISNNAITDAVGNTGGISVLANSASTPLVRGRIENNTMSLNNTATAAAIGIEASALGSARITVLINNNTVTNFGDTGVYAYSKGASSIMHATITNNTLTPAPSNLLNTFYGVDVSSGITSAQTAFLCANVNNNNVTATPGLGFDFSVVKYSASTLQIQGLTGAVANFIAAQNPPTPASEVDAFITGMATAGTCLTPP